MKRTYGGFEVRPDGTWRPALITEWDCGCAGEYHRTCGDVDKTEPLSDWQPSSTNPFKTGDHE